MYRSAFCHRCLIRKQLLEKAAVFRAESKTKKAVHLTMVSASGLLHNAHSGIILNEITGDDLFS